MKITIGDTIAVDVKTVGDLFALAERITVAVVLTPAQYEKASPEAREIIDEGISRGVVAVVRAEP